VPRAKARPQRAIYLHAAEHRCNEHAYSALGHAQQLFRGDTTSDVADAATAPHPFAQVHSARGYVVMPVSADTPGPPRPSQSAQARGPLVLSSKQHKSEPRPQVTSHLALAHPCAAFCRNRSPQESPCQYIRYFLTLVWLRTPSKTLHSVSHILHSYCVSVHLAYSCLCVTLHSFNVA
jgi:hypothetical protein